MSVNACNSDARQIGLALQPVKAILIADRDAHLIAAIVLQITPRSIRRRGGLEHPTGTFPFDLNAAVCERDAQERRGRWLSGVDTTQGQTESDVVAAGIIVMHFNRQHIIPFFERGQ